MSKNIFADPKMALGFAGATVAFALVASMGAGTFLPETQDESAPSGPVAGETETSSAPKPAVPTTTFADEDLSDDWNSDALESGSGNDGWAEAPSSVDSSPEFEDYEPERREGPRAQSAGRSNNDATRIPPRGDRGEGIPPVRLPTPPGG